MPLTDSQRNDLRDIVHACRELLLTAARERLRADYGIQPDGQVEPLNRLNLSPTDKRFRQRLVTHLEHRGATMPEPQSAKAARDAVERLAREVAFTHLNRLCAYKMMAARRILRDPVGRGSESAGFKFYCAEQLNLTVLPTGEEKDRTYRQFLEWQAAQLAAEMEALFSPDDPASGLYPPHRTLETVLEHLNREDLTPIWEDDETIGWVYQYFTPRELIRELRQHASPRDSYEMAVRNQFFTPRYVVEFLTDNTLGRLWYEMRGGETALTTRCRYFVTPEEPLPRAKKDPREIRVLDPACGSGHFLLYAFDLLLALYEEAYDDAEVGPALQREFPDHEAYRREVPRLILAHNLHGIDIDRRAAQIAALALYLRAQRAWNEMGLRRNERPPITRTHIVCAEPMPGDTARLEEFVATLDPPLIGDLVKKVFEKMTAAGVTGSLLKIEADLRDDIAEARQQWSRLGTTVVQQSFDMDDPSLVRPVAVQQRLHLDQINDVECFDQAEEQVLAALKRYAESVGTNGEDDAADALSLARRLFAGDAAHGFAFVDLCRQRYDVVLMNPPFGDAAAPSKPYVEATYGDTKGDVYKAFVECFQDRLVPGGLLGIISSRTGFFLGQSADWRERVVLRLYRPLLLADLGYGVLEAMVETAAYVLRNLTEEEREALTVSLLADLQRVPADRQGKFSRHRYAETRSGLKRHQAEQELGWLVEGGFAVQSRGELIPQTGRRSPDRYAVNGKSVRDALADAATRPPLHMPLLCLRLMAERNNAAKQVAMQAALAQPHGPGRFLADCTDFRQIPGAPFAYWVSDSIRALFTKLPKAESAERRVTKGLCTTNDERFLRLFWEVWPADIGTRREDFDTEKTWAAFAKGGASTPFYQDVALVLRWNRNGQELKDYLDAKIGGENQWSRWINSVSFYFRPGLTWPLRASRFSPQVMPSGCVFSVRGYAAFAPDDELATLLGLMASRPFDYLFKTMLGRFGFPEFVVGVLQQLPVPNLWGQPATRLGDLSRTCVDLKRSLDGAHEISHAFQCPALMQSPAETLAERATTWAQHLTEKQAEIVEHQREIDDIAFQLYSIEGADRRLIQESLQDTSPAEEAIEEHSEEEDELEEEAGEAPSANLQSLVAELISYCAGCAFGRWDVRRGTGERNPEPLPETFAPLPVCSPGMLTGEDGLPVKSAPPGYPLAIDGDGILVEDADAETGAAAHPDDLVKRVEAVLALLFGEERLEAIEREACEALGVQSLREYFRRPGAGGFWQEHIRRYSKSRRKAPIYWLLQSRRKSYSLWLYYHRLDGDILFKALVNYVEPKAKRERERLDALRGQRSGMGESGREVRQMEQRIEKQAVLVAEVEEFGAALRRAAELGLVPDLNDGVVLTIAPLRELVPWPEARRYWDELTAGKYPWSSIAQQMREKGLVRG